MPDGNDPHVPVIRYAPLGEIRIYAVTEEELDRLASSWPDSPLLSFAMALLSATLSFLITLKTAPLGPGLRRDFNFVLWATLVTGIVLLGWWIRNQFMTRRLIHQIKERMPPSPAQEAK